MTNWSILRGHGRTEPAVSRINETNYKLSPLGFRGSFEFPTKGSGIGVGTPQFE